MGREDRHGSAGRARVADCGGAAQLAIRRCETHRIGVTDLGGTGWKGANPYRSSHEHPRPFALRRIVRRKPSRSVRLAPRRRCQSISSRREPHGLGPDHPDHRALWRRWNDSILRRHVVVERICVDATVRHRRSAEPAHWLLVGLRLGAQQARAVRRHAAYGRWQQRDVGMGHQCVDSADSRHISQRAHGSGDGVLEWPSRPVRRHC